MWYLLCIYFDIYIYIIKICKSLRCSWDGEDVTILKVVIDLQLETKLGHELNCLVYVYINIYIWYAIYIKCI